MFIKKNFKIELQTSTVVFIIWNSRNNRPLDISKAYCSDNIEFLTLSLLIPVIIYYISILLMLAQSDNAKKIEVLWCCLTN